MLAANVSRFSFWVKFANFVQYKKKKYLYWIFRGVLADDERKIGICKVASNLAIQISPQNKKLNNIYKNRISELCWIPVVLYFSAP